EFTGVYRSLQEFTTVQTMSTQSSNAEAFSNECSKSSRHSRRSSRTTYQTDGSNTYRTASSATEPAVRKQQLAPAVSNLLPPRHNKLYRAPPTPDLLDRLRREKSFVLDCVAAASISDEFARTNPKYGSVLPPYNGQADVHTRRYFRFTGVDLTLARNKQSAPGTSIDGAKQDWFNSAGPSFRYLSSRNLRQPNGYSNEVRMGHDRLWEHPNPRMIRFERQSSAMPRQLIGYNGRYGYRRTTPSLRQRPSTFGVDTTYSLY
uniref:HDNR domain-containing protein n=1 Tax=Macrostomum lignano TaxID=282301 RepID=A0A1I8J0F8_9PLAT